MFTKGKRSENLLKIGILISFASCFLITNSCVSYDPTLYQGYDILNPGPEVRANPLGWVEAGIIVNDKGEKVDIMTGIVINEAFLLWVYELKEEVKKLRQELAKK